VQSLLGKIVELETFRRQEVRLTLSDRRRIVQQALVLVEQNYVHLPHKVAMHAVNPVQRLRLLQARLARTRTGSLPPADEFHGEMSEIFHGLRDLHTNYLLPDPYRGQLAFLPFLVEEFYENDRPKYLVTKVMEGAPGGAFGRGAEITHWNGMPIERAIELNAARYAGSNDAARHARGVESLTIRPLRIHRYPDEDWVVVGFTKDGSSGEFRQPWLVAPNLPPALEEDARIDETSTSIGLDLDQDEAYRARKLLFAQEIAASELDPSADQPGPSRGEIETSLPSVFRALPVTVDQVDYGYLRIFTFNVNDPDAFVAEFVRLIERLPRSGLILDVRGNGGGHIWAAELILQTLTPAVITPEPTQFINTALNAEVCRQHGDGQGGIDLGPWLPSMEQAVETGAAHSNAFSITPRDRANTIGPAVLRTCRADHRCSVLLGDGHLRRRIPGSPHRTRAGCRRQHGRRGRQRVDTQPAEPTDAGTRVVPISVSHVAGRGRHEGLDPADAASRGYRRHAGGGPGRRAGRTPPDDAARRRRQERRPDCARRGPAQSAADAQARHRSGDRGIERNADARRHHGRNGSGRRLRGRATGGVGRRPRRPADDDHESWRRCHTASADGVPPG
jgi:hypothetical protein